jgi:Flp pilus assembly protein CpaB
VAGGILIFAISRYRSSVNSAGKQSTVFVAKGLIQKGTSGDAIAAQQLFTPTNIAQQQVTAGAIADAAALHGKVAVKDVLPGEQLTQADFASSVGVATTLGPGQRVMSVPLDSAHGMTPLLKAGDHVDVYAGFNVDQGSSRPAPVMRLLMSNVQVLQTATTGGGLGGGNQAGNVALALTDLQAGKIAFSSENGKIWLVLRPGNGSTTPPTFETLGSVLTGSTPIQSPALDKVIQQIVARGQR